MSHLTTYKSQSLVNPKRELLELALEELGIKLDYSNKTIKNQWITETVDASFIYNGKRIAAGLNFKTNAQGQEEVEMAGDFWGTGINQQQLTDKMSQIYQKHSIIEKCRSQRWFVNEQDIVTKENGEIVIQAHRYA